MLPTAARARDHRRPAAVPAGRRGGAAGRVAALGAAPVAEHEPHLDGRALRDLLPRRLGVVVAGRRGHGGENPAVGARQPRQGRGQPVDAAVVAEHGLIREVGQAGQVRHDERPAVREREHRAAAGGHAPERQHDGVGGADQRGDFRRGHVLEAQRDAAAAAPGELLQAGAQPRVLALAGHREPRGSVAGQRQERRQQVLDPLVLLDPAEEEELARPVAGPGCSQRPGGWRRGERAVLDDRAPARHGAEDRELRQRRRRVREHQVARVDQGPARRHVVGEDRLVRQHVVRGPDQAHAEHPAGTQPDPEPRVGQPPQHGEAALAWQREREHPVQMDQAGPGDAPGQQLQRQQQQVERPRPGRLADVADADPEPPHLAVQQALVRIRVPGQGQNPHRRISSARAPAP